MNHSLHFAAALCTPATLTAGIDNLSHDPLWRHLGRKGDLRDDRLDTRDKFLLDQRSDQRRLTDVVIACNDDADVEPHRGWLALALVRLITYEGEQATAQPCGMCVCVCPSVSPSSVHLVDANAAGLCRVVVMVISNPSNPHSAGPTNTRTRTNSPSHMHPPSSDVCMFHFA